ncbi:hypothetical protein PVAP13_1KG197825 [Panicum virgatum]|uniref:F-box domain-containing protein n=2 Tax=Panicum virgatum TaxID=38727 RepID=A0A8T0X808_PANVG|nr:hypothetical protein PVAP13_1KG197825 [Panicum virgatum]
MKGVQLRRASTTMLKPQSDEEATVNATRARSSRRRLAATSFLPELLVVWEILVRLPAAALLRCRAVCRSWRDLTSTSEFLPAHHLRQPSLPLVSFCGEIDACRRNVDAGLDALDFRRRPAERRPVLRFSDYSRRGSFKVHASCDGLLLLSLSNNTFYICNPATRQWTTLPSLHGGVAGLYRHSSSGEYRILYKQWTDEDDFVCYYVRTVASSAKPTCVEPPAASPPMGRTPSVLLHGCIHWLPDCSHLAGKGRSGCF